LNPELVVKVTVLGSKPGNALTTKKSSHKLDWPTSKIVKPEVVTSLLQSIEIGDKVAAYPNVNNLRVRLTLHFIFVWSIITTNYIPLDYGLHETCAKSKFIAI